MPGLGELSKVMDSKAPARVVLFSGHMPCMVASREGESGFPQLSRRVPVAGPVSNSIV